MSKLGQVWREEMAGVHLRLFIAQALMAPLPIYVGSRVRPALLRLAGFQIGLGTLMWGAPTLTGVGDIARRLHIGQACWFNIGILLNLGDQIHIGDRVSIGHQVMILTETHAIGPAHRRAGELQTAPVRIGDGVWIGARVTLLPGVQVGDGAVIAAGALVSRDVAPHTLVGGVPARVLRKLDQGEGAQ